MDSSQRPPADRVGAGPRWLSRLLTEPSAGDPFAAIDLLERRTRSAARVGGDGPFGREALRFRHSRSLAFGPGDIESVSVSVSGEGEPESSAEQIELVLSVLGLTGTSSPLPTYLTREAASDDEAGQAKAEFLDLFHHRLHSLLYRGVHKFDWPNEYQRDGADPWCLRVLALLGVDAYAGPVLAALGPQGAVGLLRIAPLLLSPVRTGEQLELALSELLADTLGEGSGARAQVRVLGFAGSWTAIDEDHQLSLARANSRLGRDTILGEACLERAGMARIEIGPLDQAGLRRFQPGGRGFAAVRALLDLLSHAPIDFELELILQREAEVAAILGRSRLGDDAWLARGDAGEPDATTPARVRVSLGAAADAQASLEQP
jgi:type VI secretion system protein ImpH